MTIKFIPIDRETPYISPAKSSRIFAGRSFRLLCEIRLNRNKIFFKGLFVLMGLFFSSVVNASDYYVNNTVSSSGDGTIASPFKTIQEGISQLSPGDRLMIRGDANGQQYLDSFSLPINGISGKPITVMAYLDEKVVITGTSGERLNINKDYWDFESLIFDQANILADVIAINGNYIHLRKLEVRNGRREGISVEKASFVTIEDSYIHNFMWIDSGIQKDAHYIMIDTDRSDSITDIKILRNTYRAL